MKRVIQEAAKRFDWVIIDSAPVGAVADASVLATLVDGIVFVVRAEHSQYPAVKKAMQTLGHERILGVILNGVTPLVMETMAQNPRIDVRSGPSATLTYLGFNLDDPILRDRRVRQAIALGLDRERLVRAKFKGAAQLAQSPLDRGNPFFAPGERRWGHDPAAAQSAPARRTP